MKSRINRVKKDLRALKRSSHAIQRLIEVQGIHFLRIRALESLPKSEERDSLVSRERELVSALGLTEQIKESEEIQKRYMDAISCLDLNDRAIVLDCYLKGEPYYKVAMDYGFSEGGLRKRLEKLLKTIAENT